MKSLKLNSLESSNLSEKEMKQIKAGEILRKCTCSCYYEHSGGSTNWTNSDANFYLGENGGYSPVGDNEYSTVQFGNKTDKNG